MYSDSKHICAKYISKKTGIPIDVTRQYINQKWLDIFIKYSTYRGYSLGKTYLIYLIDWLNQCESIKDKIIMLNFIRDKLLFFSEDEIIECIKSVIPDIILPYYIKMYNDYDAVEFMMSQTIFIGMSDGAHMDYFRYYSPTIDNHQICLEFELADSKCDNIIRKLNKNSSTNTSVNIDNAINIVLLDDFSGSGIGYFRFEDCWKGKMYKILNIIKKNLSEYKKVQVIFCPYLITKKAIVYINRCISEIYGNTINFKINPVLTLQQVNLTNEERNLFAKLYNKLPIKDKNYFVGKYDNAYLGFDETSIALVIYHNTPNNSFPIIWNGSSSLFPRKNRHKTLEQFLPTTNVGV